MPPRIAPGPNSSATPRHPPAFPLARHCRKHSIAWVKCLPDYTPSSAKFGHRTNHEKSNVLRFSPRLLTHRRPSPGRTIDQVARLKEGIYHISIVDLQALVEMDMAEDGASAGNKMGNVTT